MSAEIKQGYKMTEVGVVPEDWSVQPLKNALLRGRLGGNYPNTEQDTSCPLMKMGNLARGSFVFDKVEYVCDGQQLAPEHRLKYGDVLLNTRNTLDLVGKVAIWRGELPLAYYNSNLMRLEFSPEILCSSEYANYALNHDSAIGRLRAVATGTTSVAAIYTRDLLELFFPIPPKDEQLRIGEALSDVDALITGLEQLIAKKRNIKQAAMHQLLTGQKRLPGFSGEWEVRRLGGIADLKQGYPFKSEWYTELGDFKIATIANVQDGWMKADEFNKISITPDDLQSHHRLKVGDIIVSMTGNVGRVCRVSEGGWLLNQRVGKIVPLGVCPEFLSFSLSLPSFSNSMMSMAKGGAQGNLSSSDIKSYEFCMPTSLDEQVAIANFISNMSADLEALKTRRDKTIQLKQGMMQDLLTGRIRLTTEV